MQLEVSRTIARFSRMAAACGQKDTANAPPTHSPARAPSVRNTAGGFRPAAGSKRNPKRNPKRNLSR
ncbi:MAG: hypothetical protein ACKO2L_07865, partial [Planctomycetaceae bacterium]